MSVNTEYDKANLIDEEQKNHFKSLLSEGIVSVTFTKVDGTTRVMKATLDKKLLPVFESKRDANGDEAKVTFKKSPDVVAVYDVENDGWRSIRWNSIQAFNLHVGEYNE